MARMIRNRHNGKKRYNVRWAKRGKYWYKKGQSAKYYPKNGWYIPNRRRYKRRR